MNTIVIQEVHINKKKIDDPEYIKEITKKVKKSAKIKNAINSTIAMIGICLTLVSAMTIVGLPIAMLIATMISKIEWGANVEYTEVKKLYDKLEQLIAKLKKDGAPEEAILKMEECKDEIIRKKEYLEVINNLSKDYAKDGYKYKGINIPCEISDMIISRDVFNFNQTIEYLHKKISINTKYPNFQYLEQFGLLGEKEIFKNARNKKYAYATGNGELVYSFFDQNVTDHDGFGVVYYLDTDKIRIYNYKKYIEISPKEFVDLCKKLLKDIKDLVKQYYIEESTTIDICDEFYDDIFESALFNILV